MNVLKVLRLLAASLLMFTGVLHLAMAALDAESVMAPGSALFGVLYVVLGIGLFAGRRLFSYLGAVITFVGLCVGIYAYVAIKPEPFIPPLVVVNITIILCCCYLILHKTQ